MTPQTKNRLVTGRAKGVERMRDRSPENKQKGYFVSWPYWLLDAGLEIKHSRVALLGQIAVLVKKGKI